MVSALMLLVTWQTGFSSTVDITYGTVGNAILKLDMHVPNAPGNYPCIVWIHGGGWQSGNKSNWQPARTLLTRHTQYVVASINYRLSGEALFPAQIYDCKAAIAWIRRNAATYKIDPTKMGVWGSSAGGHLAALCGTSNEMEHSDVAPHWYGNANVQASCDFYGPTNFIALANTPGFEGHASATSAESRLLGQPIRDVPEAVAAADPISYVSANDPPFYIVHGSADPVVARQQSELLEAALRKANVPVTHEVLAGAGHGGAAFVEPALIDRIHAFFQSAFGK